MTQRLIKNLLIYLACICGFALVIGIFFLLGEIANRLKPDDQILLEGEEAEPDGEHILKIYAWENVWDETETVESTVLTEMRLGDAIHVGHLREVYPQVQGEYARISRRVSTSSMLVSFTMCRTLKG